MFTFQIVRPRIQSVILKIHLKMQVRDLQAVTDVQLSFIKTTNKSIHRDYLSREKRPRDSLTMLHKKSTLQMRMDSCIRALRLFFRRLRRSPTLQARKCSFAYVKSCKKNRDQLEESSGKNSNTLLYCKNISYKNIEDGICEI